MTPRGIELELPDLPEVPIALGAVERGAARHMPRGWSVRLRDALISWLPLLLMVALALGTWWLSRQSAGSATPAPTDPRRTAPDYTMSGFTLQRFGTDGRMTLQLQGREMRHLPAVERIQVDQATVRAVGVDDRVTLAEADRLEADDAGREILLTGRARVRGLSGADEPMSIEGESVRLYPQDERLVADRPVVLRLGPHRVDAAGLSHERREGVATLQPPIRAVFMPPKAP